MFIPGVGAVVRLKQYPASPREDARVGLAGPLWGLGATAAAYAAYLGTGGGIWAAIAHFGAWVNLFNLVRSEEHTSELQSRLHLVCRLLLEKKKKQYNDMLVPADNEK